ncbi:GRP family sugar transporter [Ulvibacterium marinum]|uniref:Multidrug DMT transporter permease n=1 Tax=Ulvibacterium marinum TaxID=2419782 RepID=A0A3B0CH08_9FLAO|nr:GRP family sugar transporter [Ulvibacterium marinum]RKN82346.1 multidrug DMT transporter permease [Ulvibacterium marinum]
MFVIETYQIAVLFCIITMFAWGSWANTQKLAASSWRFELYYWDYVFGIVLFSLLFSLTAGSTGEMGRPFLEDISQGSSENFWSAVLGGILFNLANILLVAAIALAGMSVAFPVGIGLALVIGVIVNYLDQPIGNSTFLFGGVALIVVAILLNANAYRKLSAQQQKVPTKGLVLAVVAGLLMGLFYKYVANSMFPDFTQPIAGKLSPYTAVFLFALGILASNFLFNTILMRKPVEGAAVSFKDYFVGSGKSHLMGVLGGVIWCIGMSFSILASDKAGPAISYGLGQGATVVAALWGIFVWKEFKGAPKGVTGMLNAMLLLYIVGLGLIIAAR